MNRFEKLNSLSINLFEKNFHQDKNKWKHISIPTKISTSDSNRVVDLLIYENLYALITKLNVFLGDHHKIIICRRCLSSYTREDMLMLHKPKCENNGVITIRTSNESNLHWTNRFQKITLYFRKYADFEADNENDKSSVRNKTTDIYKQNPVLNGYQIVSELEDD